jgi:hypothetical protein
MPTRRQSALRIRAITFTFCALSACSHTGPAPVTSASEVTQEDSNLCAAKTSTPETWATCEGKIVRFIGTGPGIILAHPNAGGADTKQSYLEVGKRQIVVSSPAAPACSGSRVVTGILNKVDLGGAAGTRSSYQGWSITEATITCH